VRVCESLRSPFPPILVGPHSRRGTPLTVLDDISSPPCQARQTTSFCLGYSCRANCRRCALVCASSSERSSRSTRSRACSKSSCASRTSRCSKTQMCTTSSHLRRCRHSPSSPTCADCTRCARSHSTRRATVERRRRRRPRMRRPSPQLRGEDIKLHKLSCTADNSLQYATGAHNSRSRVESFKARQKFVSILHATAATSVRT
jgi:hypothetical protein